MAPPTPTLAPAIQPRNPIAARAMSYAPLTTAWSAPDSCSGNTPTIVMGTCNTKSGCSAYPTASVTKALGSGALVNFPHYTTSKVMTSGACMPPNYLALESFYFTSATGCPSGFLTATTSSAYSTLRVACCPSNYPTATWAAGEGVFDCYDIKSITSGQIFTLAAKGAITVSAANLDFWNSESIIGTTAWPTPTTAYVFHPAVNLLYASSTPGYTGSSGSGSGSSSAAVAAAGLTLFGLGLGASVAIVVVIGIVGICILCCLVCCVRVLCGRRRTKTVVTAVGTTSTVTVAGPPPGQYVGVPQQQVYGYQQQYPQPYEPYPSQFQAAPPGYAPK